MSLAYELRELEDLRARGTLSDAEFEQAKARLLNSEPVYHAAQPDGLICGIGESNWCMLMHLSQLLTFSMAGIVVPIVMWILSKDESEAARRQGACMMNWLISSLIYAVLSVILIFVAIGIPLLIVLGILQIVFPIMAAIKAHEGQTWSYPLAIEFFQED